VVRREQTSDANAANIETPYQSRSDGHYLPVQQLEASLLQQFRYATRRLCTAIDRKMLRGSPASAPVSVQSVASDLEADMHQFLQAEVAFAADSATSIAISATTATTTSDSRPGVTVENIPSATMHDHAMLTGTLTVA
jgi:hypothetical protein